MGYFEDDYRGGYWGGYSSSWGNRGWDSGFARTRTAALTRTFAEDEDTMVSYSEGRGAYASLTSKKVNLPTAEDLAEMFGIPVQDCFSAAMALSGHEGAHVKYSGGAKLVDKMNDTMAMFKGRKVTREEIKDLYNAIEDGRIDLKAGQARPGYAMDLKAYSNIIDTHMNAEKLAEDSPLSQALCALYSKNFTDEHKMYEHVRSTSGEAVEFLEELESVVDFSKIKTTDDVKATVEDVLDYIARKREDEPDMGGEGEGEGEDGEEEDEDEGGGGSSGGEGEDSDGDGDDGDGEDDADSDGSDKDSEPKGGLGVDTPDDKFTAEDTKTTPGMRAEDAKALEDKVKESLTKAMDQETDWKKVHGMAQKYKDTYPTFGEWMAAKRFTMLPGHHATLNIRTNGVKKFPDKKSPPLDRAAKTLADSVKRMFAEAFDKETGKYGKMEPTKAFKHEFSPYVFSKKHQDTGGWVIDLLIDLSGSMSGNYEKVSDVAYVVGNAFAQAGIPIRICGFGVPSGGVCEIKVFKEYDSTEYVYVSMGEIHDNRDGLHILQASYDLVQRPEPNKMLLVISDGQPAEAYVDIEKLQRLGFGVKDICKTFKGYHENVRTWREDGHGGYTTHGSVTVSAVHDTASIIRKLRAKGIIVGGMYVGISSDDREAEKLMYGNDFATLTKFDVNRLPQMVAHFLERQVKA